MEFHGPSTVAEAVSLLASDEEARCLAGGATLVAMMNADLLMPSALVSLRHIEVLRGIVRGVRRRTARGRHDDPPRGRGGGRPGRRARPSFGHRAGDRPSGDPQHGNHRRIHRARRSAGRLSRRAGGARRRGRDPGTGRDPDRRGGGFLRRLSRDRAPPGRVDRRRHAAALARRRVRRLREIRPRGGRLRHGLGRGGRRDGGRPLQLRPGRAGELRGRPRSAPRRPRNA